MALEKVLALDSTGVIEKEIDTGGGGASLPAWGMLGATVPAAGGTGTDLDTMVTQGYFVVYSPVNAPLGTVSSIHVFVLADAGGSGRSVQIAQFASQHIWYIRNQSSGVWSGWDRLLLSTDAQTSQSDITSGALLRVGAFGLGSAIAPATIDCNTITVNGLYGITSTTANTPVAGMFGTLMMTGRASSEQTQLCFSNSNPTQARIYVRNRYAVTAGVWGPWVELWTENNLVKQANSTDTTTDAILAVGAFGLGNIGNMTGLTQLELDSFLPTGIYRAATVTGIRNGTFALISKRVGTTTQTQILVASNVSDGIWYRRQSSTTLDAPWTELWTSANMVKQASATDTTVGAVLTVGAFGIGKELALAEVDLNNYSTAGSYTTPATGLLNLPAGWVQGRHVIEVAGGSSYSSQTLFGASANIGKFAIRTSSGSTFSPWITSDAIDDGVTIDNICDLAMDGQTLIHTFNPIYYKKGIGIARLLDQLKPAAINYPLSLGYDDSENTFAGTGATVAGGLAGPQMSTGTTATGYVLVRRYLTPSILAAAYDPYNFIIATNVVGQRLAASTVMYLSAASDATNTYTAKLTLLGQGPSSNTAVSATTVGLTLTYTHSVNSGNFVISYRGADGTLKTINTSVAPGFGSVSASKRYVAKAFRSAAGVSTITVNLAGTVYTITDAAFGTNSAYAKCAIGLQIVKSLGTTAVTMFTRATSLATNFP